MRMPGFAKRTRPAAVASGIALILCAALLALLPGLLRPSQARIWKGYQVILIRAGEGDARALAAVTQRFGPGVVADTTAPVEFWDFTGIATVTAAGLADRIDAEDPRFDPYMEGLSRYFRLVDRTGEWRVAYVPARLSPLRTYVSLCAALGIPWRGSWRLADFDPRSAILAAACLLAFAFVMSLSMEKSRRTGALLLLAVVGLWWPFLLAGGVARLAVCTAMVAALFPPVRALVLLHAWDERLLRDARRPLLAFAVVALAGLVLLALADGATTILFVSYGLTVVATALLLAGVARLWGRLPPSRRRRAAFDPVPIVAALSGSSLTRSVAVLVAVVGILATGLVPLMGGNSLPTPVAAGGVLDFSWRSLNALSLRNNAYSLPDISDLVTHQAYQEALAFGRPWALPRADERVYVREYLASPSGAMAARLRTVKVFDAVWLQSVWRRSPPGSLASLLLAQRRPVAVVLRTPSQSLVRDLPLALLVIAALIAWLVYDRGAGPLIRGVQVRFNGAARRNQLP